MLSIIVIRFVLADSDTLHHKLSEMSKRIRQLEDALQIAHAAVSTGHHPFLSKELLEIKNGVVATSVPEKEVSPDHELTECEKELVDSLGQLTVDEGGEIYLGGAGVSLTVLKIQRTLIYCYLGSHCRMSLLS